MFSKPRPLMSLTIKRNAILAAAPIFFLVLLALWTLVNTTVASSDSKRFTDDTFEVVKQAAQPGVKYQGVDTTQKGTTLSLPEKYDDTAQDETAALASDKRCFSVSEDIPPTLPEQSQWN